MASKARDGRGRDKKRKDGASRTMTANDETLPKTFDPLRHLGTGRSIKQYLTTVSGTKYQRTASYIA